MSTVENRSSPGWSGDAADGLRDFLPLLLPVMAFGTMFGAASSAAGYSLAMSVWASFSIFAGASQFVFLDVYRLGVPLWSVVLAVFAVNFRHLLYSAAMGSKIAHFNLPTKLAAFFLMTDLQFSAVEARHTNRAGKATGKEVRPIITPGYYFAFGLSSFALWVVATAVGALFGKLIENPATVGLDFVLPIYFLTILMGFRKRSSFLAVALTSSVVAVLVQATIGSPWHISLGALAGIAAGVASAGKADNPAVSGVEDA
jgi:4-azaleucine resistance transporter AzlC